MGGYRYLPTEQTNPVLEGITHAFTIASQMKEQGRQNEEMQIRKAHEQRLSSAEDIRQKMEAMNAGAAPVGPNGMMQTNSQMAPNPLQQALGQPGSNVQGQAPVDPGSMLKIGGQNYAYPTQAEQISTRQGIEDATANRKEKAARTLKQQELQDRIDTEGIPLPQPIAEKFGMKPGTKILPERAAGLTKMYNELMPDAAKDPKWNLQTDDHGNMSYVGMGADKQPIVVPVPGAKGKSRESMTVNLGGGRDSEQTANSKAVDRRQTTREISTLQGEEDELHQYRQALGTALGSGGKIYVTRNASGRPVVQAMAKASQGDEETQQQLMAEMKAEYEGATDRVTKKIAAKNQLIESLGGKPAVSTDQAKAQLNGGAKASPAAAPAPAAPSKYKVGQSVKMKDGSVHTITKINADGTFN